MRNFKSGDVLINRYLVLDFLAEGGMQEVYLCQDKDLDRRVVVKTPKEDTAGKRFKRGAEMGARTNHPNIAATLDYYEDDELIFLVEEFVPGKDLGDRLRDEFHFLDPFLAAHVISHVAKALYEAHRVGICHRDLKPSNIMTSLDPKISQIKLTDFGIAKMAESEMAAEIELFDQDSSTLTSSNTLLGAVPYMAPECWVNWSEAGQPMDIWALGCIAYQLLSGRTPFGNGRMAIMNVAKLSYTGVSLDKPSWFGRHANTKSVEDMLFDLILNALKLDPGERATAEDLVNYCGEICYSTSDRFLGVIDDYPLRYSSGGVAKGGFIKDSVTENNLFFHGSEFYSLDVSPVVGQRVSYSLYPGVPYPRCSPVLLIK